MPRHTKITLVPCIPMRKIDMKKKLIAITLVLGALTMNLRIVSWLDPSSVTRAEISGKDGVLTVTAQGMIVNKYAKLMFDAPAGSMSLTIANPGGANGLDPATLSVGDLLMIIQMAGASIDTSDSANYGTITNLNNAGRYELVTVGSVNSNVISINPPCSGLKFSYTASGKVQVIRVPQYTTLTVNAGASLTAPAWNGVT